MCYALVVEWTSSPIATNNAVYEWVAETIAQMRTATKALGVWDPFHYMGDSAGFQIPGFYDGYGDGNAGKLLAISRKYDPQRIFQRLMPGGFKLGV